MITRTKRVGGELFFHQLYQFPASQLIRRLPNNDQPEIPQQ
jgi:hypothetical protein